MKEKRISLSNFSSSVFCKAFPAISFATISGLEATLENSVVVSVAFFDSQPSMRFAKALAPAPTTAPIVAPRAALVASVPSADSATAPTAPAAVVPAI